jgi:TetR/AcrR family transcriptional repressor of bet genes
MPRLGREPIRRDALVQATIAEIGQRGAGDVTVAQIARRAGMSTALAHHYGGAKDAMFLAAMRRILSDYGLAVRRALRGRTVPRARLDAVVRASFEAGNLHGDVVAAWLDFYVIARNSPDAARLLRIYRARLRSNLLHPLRPLAGRRAEGMADVAAALIDGLYLRSAQDGGADGHADLVLATLDALLDAGA